jgi:hypothetical protein
LIKEVVYLLDKEEQDAFDNITIFVTAGSLQRLKHSVQLNPNVIENIKLRKLKGEGNLDL